MKTSLIIPLLLVSGMGGRAALPVTDVSVLAQTVEQVRIATEQIALVTQQVERLGNPGDIKPPSVFAVMDSLSVVGVGQTLEQLRIEATGSAALADDGGGLYRVVGDVVTAANGQQFIRPAEPYRKYDAVTRSVAVLEEVMTDTETRRQSVRADLKTTTAQLGQATTVAEVQKLQGIIAAQGVELAAIDRERDAAMHRVVLQNIANQTDHQKQEQARREERKVDFQTATEKMAVFLTPDSSPGLIPAPHQTRP